jgi:uncharacterized iron-regulated membrane protein
MQAKLKWTDDMVLIGGIIGGGIGLLCIVIVVVGLIVTRRRRRRQQRDRQSGEAESLSTIATQMQPPPRSPQVASYAVIPRSSQSQGTNY